jgi:hypothetical protein
MCNIKGHKGLEKACRLEKKNIWTNKKDHNFCTDILKRKIDFSVFGGM